MFIFRYSKLNLNAGSQMTKYRYTLNAICVPCMVFLTNLVRFSINFLNFPTFNTSTSYYTFYKVLLYFPFRSHSHSESSAHHKSFTNHSLRICIVDAIQSYHLHSHSHLHFHCHSSLNVSLIRSSKSDSEWEWESDWDK